MTKDSAALPRRQHGGIAVLTGIAITVLVGMAGLVLDLAHLYITKTELQNAADACALSAARELSALNGSTVTRATSAGIAAGRLNLVDFQSAAADVQDADITFGPNLDADANGKLLNFTRSTDQNTEYVRCAPHETQRKSVLMWFMGVMGIDQRDMQADAVARYPKAAPRCGIPLAVCTDNAAAPNMSFTVGTWYSGRLEAGTAVQGNYGWVRFPNQDTGTEALSEVIAGEGLCELDETEVVFQNTGVSNGAAKAWNTRFGLYGAPYTKDEENLTNHRPDQTGWSYQNPVAGGVYDDFVVRQGNHVPYSPSNIVDGKGKPVDYPGTPTSASHDELVTYGGQRRMVAMPVISCSSWAAKKEMPVIGWACSLMVAPMEDAQGEVRLEFRGIVGSETCGGAASSNSGFPKLVR